MVLRASETFEGLTPRSKSDALFTRRAMLLIMEVDWVATLHMHARQGLEAVSCCLRVVLPGRERAPRSLRSER